MSPQNPLTDDERQLAGELGGAPAPRRTDAAFALAVRSGVDARRRRAFALPLLLSGAAASAALFLALAGPLTPPGDAPSTLLDATLAALDEDEAGIALSLGETDDALAALAAAGYVDTFLAQDAQDEQDEMAATDWVALEAALDDDFDEDLDDDDEGSAWPSLDGADDDALLALSAALDDAIANKKL